MNEITDFRSELGRIINTHSIENGSDTPDFILAEYLNDCLLAFDKATKRRTEWYKPEPEKKEHPKTIDRKCPECGKLSSEHPTERCDMVYGRRGWRQLGVYDG